MNISTHSKIKEYKTSKNEMNRRKRAFITLSISIFLSICIFSLDAIVSLPEILAPTLIIFAIILILLIVKINKTLVDQACLQICLSDSELEWKFKDPSNSNKCLLSDIKSLRIKRTIKGLLREIRIVIPGMKFLYINGLENFEEFIDDLISKNENVKIIRFKEFIDFDHPLYYVFFGTVVGIVTTLLFRLIPLISENNIKYVQFSSACFIIFTGMIFIINKPIRGRYGNKNIIADYICGLLFLAIGVLIVICSRVFL